MRIIKFLDDERHRDLFASMFVVFASSNALPQSMEDLLAARSIKQKFVAVSDPDPNGRKFDRVMKEGEQVVKFKNSEWQYLYGRLQPPVGQWTNFGADSALDVLEMVKEAPQEES